MPQAGKQSGQQLGVTSIAGHTQSRLVYILDRASSGLKFLIDTGVEVNVVPRLHTHRKTQKGPSLQAINNTSIPTHGTCLLTLNLGLRHTFKWVFIIADTFKAILSADFFEALWFSVDMQLHCLLDPLTHLKVQGIASLVTSSLVLSLLSRQPKSDYQRILMDFPTITNPYNGNVEIKHNVTNHIETRGLTVRVKP